ncbi:pilus assembly protein [Mesorhizobium sp. A556]
MLKRFLVDRSGNYVMLLAVMTLPLLLAIGFSVDYVRYVAAKQHLQDLADAASLAVAASPERDDTKLRVLAGEMVVGNTSINRIENVTVASLDIKDDKVDLGLGGNIPTYFMGLANIHRLDVQASALAVRAVTGSVEVALVLDNTWSMSEEDTSGKTKIAALKDAAKSLADKLMTGDGAKNVRMGLVPYADYVNVGTQYRSASWLSVSADSVGPTPPPRTCEMKKVVSKPCTGNAPSKTCTRYVDGVPEKYECGKQCISWGPEKTEIKEQCSGGGTATVKKWWGCVVSRKTGEARLNDGSPSVPYPGYIETKQTCLNPIVPLTNNVSSLDAAITGMIINIGNYKPYTYIPAGLIWGLNILSPLEPFSQAMAYDPDNKNPRKAVVLMTDGENFMNFRKSDGRHTAVAYPEYESGFDPKNKAHADARAAQMKATNDDTLAICNHIKAQNIEVYTVAFMVEMDFSKRLLQDCATDAEHYFDASDSAKLLASFEQIAKSLTQVRLAR